MELHYQGLQSKSVTGRVQQWQWCSAATRPTESITSTVREPTLSDNIHLKPTAKGVLHWKSPPLQSNSTCQIHEGDPFMCSDPPPGHQICQYGFAPLQISGFMPAVYHFIVVLPVRSGLRLYHLEGTSIFVCFDCLFDMIWFQKLSPKLSPNKIPSM